MRTLLIEDRAIAEDISALMLRHSADLNESLSRVKNTCSDEEFHSYRTAVAFILEQILIRVLNPIYAQHPEIKPPQMK